MFNHLLVGEGRNYEQDGAVGIHMVGAVLGIVFEHKDGAMRPVTAV